MKTHPRLHPIRDLTRIMLTLLISSVLVLWAWNTFMPEVLELAAIQYKHALALVILFSGVSFIFNRRHPAGSQDTMGEIRGVMQ